MYNDNIRKSVRNTDEAWDVYRNGNGEPVELGDNIKKASEQHPDQLRRLDRIMSGKTTVMDGNYGVDMTNDYFFVGDTAVEYSISCAVTVCVAKFTGCARNEFWDVTPFGDDGMGPKGELPGGNPYPFVPHRWTSDAFIDVYSKKNE